jgi:hypothetical protein
LIVVRMHFREPPSSCETVKQGKPTPEAYSPHPVSCNIPAVD